MQILEPKGFSMVIIIMVRLHLSGIDSKKRGKSKSVNRS